MDRRAKKCIMIGYAINSTRDTYRMFDPATKHVIETRDVKWSDWHGLMNREPTQGMKEFKEENTSTREETKSRSTDQDESKTRSYEIEDDDV